MEPEVISQEVATVALSWPDKAAAVRIANQASYDEATNIGRGVQELIKQIESEFKEPKEKAYAAHKAITAMEKKYLDPLVLAKSIIAKEMGRWAEEQEVLRRKEEARLRAEQLKREEEERIAAAIEAEQAGASEAEVQAVIETPVFVAPVIAAPTFQKAAGVVTAVTWSAEVVSIKQLCAEVAAGRQPETVVVANMPVLNKLAVALKQAFNIPGVKAVSKTGTSFR